MSDDEPLDIHDHDITERDTLRAFVEAIVPQDDTVGAGDVSAESFVAHYLEFVSPGLVAVLTAALDGAAAGVAGVPFHAGAFATSTIEARLAAIRGLGAHDSADLRELADRAIALTIAAFYGEWTGQDERGRLVGTPVGWELIGYAGPAVASDLLSDG